jgi:protein-S-isoprenylcysteine O-methyltransferase Ste14
VREEESFLEEKYGEKYVMYKTRVGRFVPKI